jgi:three-Cys-motif partner protein
MQIEPKDDGLELPEVGSWSQRKYHYLSRYLDAFTTAMRSKWREIHYVDLFAGAGFARVKDSREVVATSAVLAANVRFPFTQLHLCDEATANAASLRARLTTLKNPPRIVQGDANSVIDSLIQPIPKRDALCVTFADPFGLHLDFKTVTRIGEIKSDLIVLLADNMDALRNWATYYLSNPASNLDRFMGEPGWRDLLKQTPTDQQAQALRKRYQDRLRSVCGYQHFAYETVQNSHGRDIYKLLYASRHETGIKIWNGISRIDESGQRKLFDA